MLSKVAKNNLPYKQTSVLELLDKYLIKNNEDAETIFKIINNLKRTIASDIADDVLGYDPRTKEWVYKNIGLGIDIDKMIQDAEEKNDYDASDEEHYKDFILDDVREEIKNEITKLMNQEDFDFTEYYLDYLLGIHESE